ncbi:MAG: zinc-binding alcohol dehydrogenase family protein [Salinivirgaceae bacterium]|nr:zinc-binding alcohol dehydrogenase family protein [Salinivirgaceae bacterium]
MKAIEIQTPGNVAVVDVEKPTAKSGEVLLKLDYVGFCGSDLNTYRGGNTMVTFPRIPGHEIGATIVEIGNDVPSQLKVGQVVTVNPYTNCGHCASCRRGRVNACENNETLGVQRNGAMQEFISLPWQKIILCGSVSLRDAALIEPMSVGFHAVDRGRVTDTDIVMVIGCGMVGLGAVVRAVMRGATVIAADLDDEKLALARQLGATYTYNTATEWTLPSPDVVIEAVGAAPTYQLAVNKVAFTGRIVCIGYAKADIALTTSLFVKKELDIMGSRNANPSDFEAVIKYLTNSGAPVEKFISRIIEPQQSAEALKTWAEAPGKVFRILVKW